MNITDMKLLNWASIQSRFQRQESGQKTAKKVVWSNYKQYNLPLLAAQRMVMEEQWKSLPHGIPSSPLN